MSLYKRKDSPNWWVKITIRPPGQSAITVQESTGTRDEITAQEYRDRRKADLWREIRLKERPRILWEEAVIKFLGETSGKRDHQGDIDRLRWLDAYLGGLYLDEIDRHVIERIKSAKKERAAGTINRYLATVRTILRKAEREWDVLEKAPHIRLLPEPQKRVRWITPAEAQRLLDELPERLSAMAALSLCTGMRQRNVLRLEWSQIDMQRHVAWIHPDQAKGKRSIAIPLNADAIAILRRQIGSDDRYVFVVKDGQPPKGVDSGVWKAALARAGIEDFRWHDLRHTWASWHVQAGTSLQELMELGGWSSYSMVLRYAHLSSQHLQNVAGNVALPVTIQLRKAPSLAVVQGGKDA